MGLTPHGYLATLDLQAYLIPRGLHNGVQLAFQSQTRIILSHLFNHQYQRSHYSAVHDAFIKSRCYYINGNERSEVTPPFFFGGDMVAWL